MKSGIKSAVRSAAACALRKTCRAFGPVRLAELFRENLRSDPDASVRHAESFLMTLMPDRPWSDGFERDVLLRRAATGVPIDLASTDPETARLLDEIPSETTKAERRFLHAFFSRVWSGRGDVFEVGPFLGGTTRAIAMGMMENPCLAADARFRTFDKFTNYYRVEDLANLLKPYFAARGMTPDEQRALVGDGNFLDVFRRIHRGHAYGRLLVEEDRILPDWPGDAERLANIIRLDPGSHIHSAFIDGCKSWYSTKHCMKLLAPHVPAGGFLLFQDYGWYTCFWLPSFIGLSGVRARLFGHVDSTYVFQLLEPMDADRIDRSFPDTPDALTPADFRRTFEPMIDAAQRRDDARGFLILRMQLGAALAYTGHEAEAIRCLDDVARLPVAARYRGLVMDARRSPTYRPPDRGGPLYLPASSGAPKA